jgi:Flp pilus assembly protein TadG
MLRSRRAVAGVEFALVLPFLLALLAGAVDLSTAWLTTRRLVAAAEQTGLVATTLAVQAATLGQLSGLQAWKATTAPFASFPGWSASATSGYSITLSEIVFTAGKGGSYAGAVKWSVAFPGGAPVLRPCGTVTSLPAGSRSLTGVPAGVFGPTAVLVADISTLFVPPLTGVFTGPVTLAESAFVSPRVNNAVTLTGSGPAVTKICS